METVKEGIRRSVLQDAVLALDKLGISPNGRPRKDRQAKPYLQEKKSLKGWCIIVNCQGILDGS